MLARAYRALPKDARGPIRRTVRQVQTTTYEPYEDKMVWDLLALLDPPSIVLFASDATYLRNRWSIALTMMEAQMGQMLMHAPWLDGMPSAVIACIALVLCKALLRSLEKKAFVPKM
jgi:hypothetical protein